MSCWMWQVGPLDEGLGDAKDRRILLCDERGTGQRVWVKLNGRVFVNF